jgi:hypothetical protein
LGRLLGILSTLAGTKRCGIFPGASSLLGGGGTYGAWGGGGADFDGDDVPDVEGDDVGGEEVGVFAGVGDVLAVDVVGGAGFVSVGAEAFGAFGLDAPEAGAVVDDEVVALAVSPGLGDGEVKAEGAGQEGGFGALPGALGVGAGDLVGDCE